MDNSGQRFNRNSDYLGVNKVGKNIKKSPLHQPNFNNTNGARPQAQPQVYNINKNDFRSIVQQLTGSPSQEPPQNPSSMRLQGIRPPPLTPIRIPIHHPPHGVPYNNNMVRLAPHYAQPSPSMLPPTPGDVWTNTAESPISVYMRYLQNSIIDARQTQDPPSSALLPSPGFNARPPPPYPSPGVNGPPLPSPISQFLLQSPTSFFDLLSPYPFVSPVMQHPPPLTPVFSFSPLAQPGILGPASGFPLSPSGIFPPRWRDQ